MRKSLIGLALILAATPAQAQTLAQDRAACMSQRLDLKIEGCSADIVSGQESTSNLAIAYSNRATAFDAQGLHDRAIADATQAIALNPNYADGYNVRAWAYHGEAQDARGLPDAEQAVALAPHDAYALETRAEIYERLNRHEAAAADYRAALTIVPNLREAQQGLERLHAPP